jgi:hypothetical protein
VKTVKTLRLSWPDTSVREMRWSKWDPNYVRRTMREPILWRTSMLLPLSDRLYSPLTVRRTPPPTFSKSSTDLERPLTKGIRVEWASVQEVRRLKLELAINSAQHTIFLKVRNRSTIPMKITHKFLGTEKLNYFVS